MIALRRAQPLLATVLHQSSPKIIASFSMAAAVDNAGAINAVIVSGTGQDQLLLVGLPSKQHQQARSYGTGNTCPAVRGYAAKHKRAAAAAAAASKSDTYATSAAAAEHYASKSAAEAMTVASMADLKVASTGGDGGPTMEIAKSMPISYKSMDNISLLTLSALKVEPARAEMLKRHIMTVDDVSYVEACKTFEEIAAENRKGMLRHTIPYKVGITAAVGGGVLSIPLCFHLPTVQWFNEHYVTTDVPEPQDLETWLEVGSWAWNWMEPPLGQISFFLLCLQFARAQIANLGVRPYTAKMKAMRADKIVAKYSQYDGTLLSNWSKSVSYY